MTLDLHWRQCCLVISILMDAQFLQERANLPQVGVHHEIVIYTTQHCPIWVYAYEIAALIRREFPTITVSVVEIAAAGELLPERVFATPTYCQRTGAGFLAIRRLLM